MAQRPPASMVVMLSAASLMVASVADKRSPAVEGLISMGWTLQHKIQTS